MTSATKHAKEKTLSAQALKLIEPEFIEQQVCPAAFGAGGGTDYPVQAWVVQQKPGTGRVSLCYDFGERGTVFGKFYSNFYFLGTTNLGPRSFQVLQELWHEGFGEGEPYQVVEPLAYLSDHSPILTRGAAGTCLTYLLEQGRAELPNWMRQVAQWLARLHSSPVRVGRSESAWDTPPLFRILDRLTRACGQSPHSQAWLMPMVDRLYQEGQASIPGGLRVQTHGRFNTDHIFFADGAVSLIDFDRSLPSDPAKDIAEFLSSYRRWAYGAGATTEAETATATLLEEYRSQLPEGLKTLNLQWGARLLFDLLGLLGSTDPEQPTGADIEYYVQEFDEVLGEKWRS
ncbi:MAG: aminoglycoside phosphotransferase family protein [Dehalococcoidia bacterium]